MSVYRSETLAARIARILASRIIQGQIPAGERLRQDHIAAEFGSSHVPVREAFRLLEAQGLAENLPRRGVRVSGFDLDALREVAHMRAALEALALRHAAPNIDKNLLLKAESLTDKAEGAENVQEWEEANRQFHRLILTPCNMPRLLATIDDLHAASARFLFAAWRQEWESRTDHDHRTIIDALRKGQVDLACTTLARHVGRIGKQSFRSKISEKTFGYTIPI